MAEDIQDPIDDSKEDAVRILAALVRCDLQATDHLAQLGDLAALKLNVRLAQQELCDIQNLARLIAASIRDGRDGQLLRLRFALRAMTSYSVHTMKRRSFVLQMVRDHIAMFPRDQKITQYLICDACGRRVPYARGTSIPCETLSDDDDAPCDGSWKETFKDTTLEDRNRVAGSLKANLSDIEPLFTRLNVQRICEVLGKYAAPRAAGELSHETNAFDDGAAHPREVGKTYTSAWTKAMKKQKADRKAATGQPSAPSSAEEDDAMDENEDLDIDF